MDTSAGATPFPHLRLVRAPETRSGPLHRLSDPVSPLAALERVAAENRHAARLAAGKTPAGADDALHILALRAAECLDGGRAAILRPERRKRLLRVAHMLGVGQFDANLVIAIVQDNARRGMVEATKTDPRLSVLAPRARGRAASWAPLSWIVPQLIAAGSLAALLLYAMVRWIGS